MSERDAVSGTSADVENEQPEGAGGEGEETPTPAAPPAPSIPPEVTARLAQLEAQAQALAQQNQYLAQLTAQRRAPAVEEEEPPPELDKAAKQYLDRIQAANEARIYEMQERMDRAAFQQAAERAGLDPEDVKAVNAQHNAWKRNGVMMTMPDGTVASPTLHDALLLHLGKQALEARRAGGHGGGAGSGAGVGQGGRRAAEPVVTERSGNRAPPSRPANLDRMSSRERIEKYWNKALEDLEF